MIVFCKLRIWFLQKFNNFTNKKLDFFREIVCFICILLFANNFVCWKMQTIFVCEEFAKYSKHLLSLVQFVTNHISTYIYITTSITCLNVESNFEIFICLLASSLCTFIYLSLFDRYSFLTRIKLDFAKVSKIVIRNKESVLRKNQFE